MRRRLIQVVLAGLSVASAAAAWVCEPLHEFERAGTQPMAPLVRHADGNFYGTTVEGGGFGQGSVFKLTPGGGLTSLYSFDGATGVAPIAGLAEGPGGELFGTTSGGGANGFGVAFKISTAGEFTKLVDFTGSGGAAKGSVPGPLVLHPDGAFYGTTQAGGSSGFGTVFSLTPGGVLTTLAEFTGTAGAVPGSMPVGALAVDGSDLFGVTQEGGGSNVGTVFSLTTAGVYAAIDDFDGSNGANPAAGLVLHSDGLVYGCAEFGGANGFGTAFKVTTGPSPVLSVLRSFDDPSGSQPVGELVEGGDGALYGATSAGGAVGWGTVFRLTTGGAHTVLVDFSGQAGASPGSTPRAGMVLTAGGELVGTTSAGGPGNLGLVFQTTLAGSSTTRANCSLPLGWMPSGAPVADGSGGILFPVAEGGDGGGGALLQWSEAGGLVLADALGGGLGTSPDGALVQVGANFYGVTSAGGAHGRGTAFRYDPVNGAVLLADYTSAGGSAAEGPMVEGADGALYGVAREGGASARGTVYRLTTAGVRTPLVSMTGLFGAALGREPQGGLALAANGDFYGLTRLGGGSNQGVLFRVSSTGSYSVLQSFASPGPHFPQGGLVADGSGDLFGATRAGGAAGAGALIRLDPTTDNGSTVAEFTDGVGSSAGREPVGELAVAADGAVWGTLAGGGPDGVGGVFAYDTTRGLETVVSFTGAGGSAPGVALVDGGLGTEFTGGLLPQADGSLLGTVPGGGAGGGGVLFRLRILTPLEEWKLAMLGSIDAPDLGDPDNDRLANLLEYALLQSPVLSEPAGGLPTGIQTYAEGERLTVLVPRDPSRNDVTMIVEACDNLVGPWTMLATSVHGAPFAGPGYVGGDSAGPGVKSVEVRDVVNVSAGPRRFLRLRVTH